MLKKDQPVVVVLTCIDTGKNTLLLWAMYILDTVFTSCCSAHIHICQHSKFLAQYLHLQVLLGNEHVWLWCSHIHGGYVAVNSSWEVFQEAELPNSNRAANTVISVREAALEIKLARQAFFATEPCPRPYISVDSYWKVYTSFNSLVNCLFFKYVFFIYILYISI